MALILKDCLAPELSKLLKCQFSADITSGTLDIVIIPVLAGSDALLGPIVFDALHSFKLEVGAHSSLEIT